MQEVPDTTIEALHESTMGTAIYQLYDGTLKLWGCKKMLWHRLAIDERKLQMLPEDRRSFPFAPCIGNNSEKPFDASQAIDLRPYTNRREHQSIKGKSVAQKKCAAHLLDQLQKDGFCLTRGTGMDPVVCQRALDVTNAFLQDANESVRRSCLARSDRALRGYSPMNVENFASLVGEQGPNDLVRKFRMGPIQPGTDVVLMSIASLRQVARYYNRMFGRHHRTGTVVIYFNRRSKSTTQPYALQRMMWFEPSAMVCFWRIPTWNPRFSL